MSYTDEFLKELRKRRISIENTEEESTERLLRSDSIKTEDPFTRAFLTELDKFQTPSTPLTQKPEEEDIAPVKEEEDEGLLDFFNKGSLSDGYQFGDILLGVGATAGDIGLGLAQGVGQTVEGVTDLLLYGVGGVSRMLGADEFADNTKKLASKNSVNDAFEELREGAIADNSFLGRTSQAVAQGLGQVGTMIATGGVGAAAGLGKAGVTALTMGTMGASGMGSGMSEAYQSGATDEEALTYGLIAGGADAITEMLFGGMGKGVQAVGLSSGIGGLDDILAKKVSSKFQNQIVKNFAEFGVKATGEGVEEVLAGIAQAAGKKATYLSEEEFGDILADENLLEQFVVGAVTSGMAQSGYVPGMKNGSLREANKAGRDYITGYSQNEQAVIDKEIENRIAEQEEKGTKLSGREKNKIYDEVVLDMEKGRISTDTIESALGGESFNRYKTMSEQETQLKANEKKLTEEIDALMHKPNYTMADTERVREANNELDSIREQLKTIDTKTAKKSLFDEVDNLTQGDYRLRESYNEIGRRRESFTADLTQYDEKQQEVVKKAIDSGILNNSNRTHEFVDMVAKISADKGVSFDFTNNQKLKESGFAVDGKTVNGLVTKDGITVNIQSSKSLNSVVGHEIAHVLEGTEHYTELQKAVTQWAKTKGVYDSKYNDIKSLYTQEDGSLVTDATSIESEVVADLVGDYLFTDSEFVNNLSVEHRNVFQKIYDEIKYLVKIATAGSKEARELERVKREFDKAYKDNVKGKTDTKYSLAMVEEVQPKSDKWHRTLTTEEAKARFPKLWDVAAEESEVRNPTQISSTVKSYRKVYDFLKAEGFDGTILDASSGLGYGTKAGIEEYGFNVEDIEPYPDKSYNPKYKDYSALNKKYDTIISNAVLNVLPQDQRDALVVKMGELLNDGGRMFINVRGKDVDTLAANKNNTNISPMEWFVDSTGSYQKGFTKPELVAYLEDALGEGFTVKPTNMFGAVSAIVTKDGGVNAEPTGNSDIRYSLTENQIVPPTDTMYSLAAVPSHKKKLENAYSVESSTDLETIVSRYDKIIEIWERLGGELDSKFLNDWNNKAKPDKEFTVFKAQAGYKYNVELSTMCKKGIPLFEAIDTIVKKEVMKDLGIEKIGKAEKEILYDVLKQHNFEIPCAICYVEQARQREGVIIDAFLNGKTETNSKGEVGKVKLGWNNVLATIEQEMRARGVEFTFPEVSRDIATDAYSPVNIEMNEDTTTVFLESLKDIANQEITRYNKAENKKRPLLKDVAPEAVKEAFKGTLPSNLKLFKVLFTEPSSRFKIQTDLLYSSLTTQNLARAHNGLYGLFNSQGGVSGYKTKQGTTAYWGDILGKKWVPETIRNEGGVRNQSNSDFQMFTLLDQAQMYIDFTAKGYYLQAYTKVLSELKLFGLSKGKINASLIPKVVVYRDANGNVDVQRTMENAGLDENGNPIFDDIEGINHTEAFMLLEDPEYSKNIGGICIGYSDNHIRALLDDPRVQQIIGFHDKTDDPTKRYVGARYAKNYNGLNEAIKDNGAGETVHIGFNSFVKKAENKFKYNKQTESFEGTINYNGKTYTADDIPKLAADLYLEMAKNKNYKPAYDDFKSHENYYKLLADFSLYDSQGRYAPHRKVDYNMPDSVPYLDADGNKQYMDTEEYIRIELEKELAVRDAISEALSDTSEDGIIPQFKQRVKDLHSGNIAPVQASLSTEGEQIAPIGDFNIYGEDVMLESDIAPVEVQEEVNLPETNAIEYESVPEGTEELWERLSSLEDADAPPEAETIPYEDEPTLPDNPFEDRDYKAVGNRKVKAYMFENPDVKPFFQEEANIMLGELERSTKGQRHFNDELYYESGGEFGWGGTTRHTSDEIAYLLDSGYTYAEVEKGLNAIIEDNGKENIAVAKRIEFLLNDRLLQGYTDFITGDFVPANQGYIALQNEKQATARNEEGLADLVENAEQYAPEPTEADLVETEPLYESETIETGEEIGQQKLFEDEPKKYSDMDRLEKRLYRIDKSLKEDLLTLRSEYEQNKAQATADIKDKNAYISKKADALYKEILGMRKGVRVSQELGNLLDFRFDYSDLKTALVHAKQWSDRTVNENSVVESVVRQYLNENYAARELEVLNMDREYNEQVKQLEDNAEAERKAAQKAEETVKRSELHALIIDRFRNFFKSNGADFDEAFKNGKNLSTLKTVDNTPVRVNEKAFGAKAGGLINELTVNQVALNESKATKWLDSFTNRKTGLLAKIAGEHNIKPGSKEDAAAQMYAEGFYVNGKGEYVAYTDSELAMDFPDAKVRENIKGLANDTRIRQIYDETLTAINESRVRNGYPEIPRRENYFRHFREETDFFSKHGIPFNPDSIKSKDLPTDINGRTVDLKPGQPFFANAMQRMGNKTSYSLLGGLEGYLQSAKSQIYHIDDIQNFRALQNYLADTFGQMHGLEGLDDLPENEQAQRIKEVMDNHMSSYVAFLNEEANIIAGKTALIDRAVEGMIGRRGLQFLNTLNSQVGKNMVGFNVSSALTGLEGVAAALPKLKKATALKAFSQLMANKINSINGKTDGFAEYNPALIRRRGADRFHRKTFEKISDMGYALMSGVDNLSAEFIVRAKYNEFIEQGMDSEQANIQAGEWAMRLLGDRTVGQQPLLYNSKTLGIITKFQLEVRNRLDSMFFDTIQDATVSTEDIVNAKERNAKKAAKITSTLVQSALFLHLFGKAFESVAGYNPTFDIVSTLIKLFGFDDEEDEDTILDNVDQAFQELMGDLPYSSVLTGGRIPLSEALPIKELVEGKDSFGNEKPRWETLLETAPYWVMPGGYSQAKKTTTGLGMFAEDVPGSYTDSGNLRYPVEPTLGNVIQAGIFGQYANENAREYFDNERLPLKQNQIKEFAELDIPIGEYWEYRDGLKDLKTIEEKVEYINGLDLSDDKKNILINNIVDRKEDVDLTDYEDFSGFDEFDFASKNPEKYEFFEANNISYEAYNASDDSREAYNWAYNNPEKYVLSKAVASDVVTYRQYTKALNDIEADKDEYGKTISGSRKDKVLSYINSMDADYGEKIILFKSEYKSDDTYNTEIVEYLNAREDISYEEMVVILQELDFIVTSDGQVYWD